MRVGMHKIVAVNVALVTVLQKCISAGLPNELSIVSISTKGVAAFHVSMGKANR